MTVLRLIGMLFLMAAVIALTADLSRTAPSNGGPAFASLLKHWSDVAPQTLAGAQKGVGSSTHPVIWDGVIRPFLLIPAWMSLGAIGAGAVWFGRRRRKVEIFVN